MSNSNLFYWRGRLMRFFLFFKLLYFILTSSMKMKWSLRSRLKYHSWALALDEPWRSFCLRSFSQKIESANPAQLAKRANPRYFILLCGISCELAGYVHRPIVDSESMIAGWGQTKTLVSYTLAGLAELSRLSSIFLKHPPLYTHETSTALPHIHH